MQNMLSKSLFIGIIVLFIGTSFSSAFFVNIKEEEYDNNIMYNNNNSFQNNDIFKNHIYQSKSD